MRTPTYYHSFISQIQQSRCNVKDTLLEYLLLDKVNLALSVLGLFSPFQNK